MLVTLVIGGVVGWLASVVMRTNAQMGILANVVVGIVGSFLGQAIFNSLGVAPRTEAMSWVAAVAGASLLIWLLKALGVFRTLVSAR